MTSSASLPSIPDTVRVHALASGSSGNAFLVQAGETSLLLDAGISAARLSEALRRRGTYGHNLNAIFLTHEHADHIHAAGAMSRKSRAPLIANRATLQRCQEFEELEFACREMPTGDEIGIGPFGVRSFPVSHDAVEPVGYVITLGEIQIVYCTDMGMATPEVQDALRGASLAIVESNYDPDWLARCSYPRIMKQRIASTTGHLSNPDCAHLLARRLEEGGSLSVWLAHLSRQTNSPALARRSVLSRLAEQTRTPVALEVALRDHPSVSWSQRTSGTRSLTFS
jgi:phosphoribosyl 1,2-cyclic phosphodiesterase